MAVFRSRFYWMGFNVRSLGSGWRVSGLRRGMI